MWIIYEILYVSQLVIIPLLMTKFLKESLKSSILFCLIGLFIGLYIALTAFSTSFFTMKLDLFTASILFHLNLAISGFIVGPIIFLISSLFGKNLLSNPPQTGAMFKNIYAVVIPVLYAVAGLLIGLVKSKLKGQV